MPPLPKRRHSTNRQGRRRFNQAISLKNFIKCSRCQAEKLPHRACPNCGAYQPD